MKIVNLLPIKLFQICMSLMNTKEDILKNIGYQVAIDFHSIFFLLVNGCHQLSGIQHS